MLPSKQKYWNFIASILFQLTFYFIFTQLWICKIFYFQISFFVKISSGLISLMWQTKLITLFLFSCRRARNICCNHPNDPWGEWHETAIGSFLLTFKICSRCHPVLKAFLSLFRCASNRDNYKPQTYIHPTDTISLHFLHEKIHCWAFISNIYSHWQQIITSTDFICQYIIYNSIYETIYEFIYKTIYGPSKNERNSYMEPYIIAYKTIYNSASVIILRLDRNELIYWMQGELKRLGDPVF